MKTCRTCHKRKDKECFYRNTLTGYSKQCKSCARQYAINRQKLRKEIK